jgi:hypothetical protein
VDDWPTALRWPITSPYNRPAVYVLHRSRCGQSASSLCCGLIMWWTFSQQPVRWVLLGRDGPGAASSSDRGPSGGRERRGWGEACSQGRHQEQAADRAQADPETHTQVGVELTSFSSFFSSARGGASTSRTRAVLPGKALRISISVSFTAVCVSSISRTRCRLCSRSAS